MAQNFLGCDRGQVFLLPPSVDDWLPADHFARFVIAIVEELDLAAFLAADSQRSPGTPCPRCTHARSPATTAAHTHRRRPAARPSSPERAPDAPDRPRGTRRLITARSRAFVSVTSRRWRASLV